MSLHDMKWSPAAIVTAVLWLCSPLMAEDWPRFRGPQGNGFSGEKLALLADPTQAWKVSVGAGSGALVVHDGRVYTLGGRPGRGTHLVCLDAASGKELWAEPVHCWYATSCPAVDRGRVYVLATPQNKPVMYCLDAATGKPIWRREWPKPELVREYGHAGAPLLWEDLIILNVGTGVALKRETGEVVWQHQGLAGLATPVLYEEKGKAQVLIFGGDALYARDARTGRELWSLPWKTQLAVNAADPIYHDGKVYVSTSYGKHAALFDVSTGTPRELWRQQGSSFSSGILWKDQLYCFSGSKFACVDFLTGEKKWTVDRIGAGSVLAADNKLILLSETGQLSIGELSPREFRPTVQKQVLEGITYPPPALANGKLYVRNKEGEVVCLRLAREGT